MQRAESCFQGQGRDSGDVYSFFLFFFPSPFWLSPPLFFFLLRVDENKIKRMLVFYFYFISLVLSYERPGGREEHE